MTSSEVRQLLAHKKVKSNQVLIHHRRRDSYYEVIGPCKIKEGEEWHDGMIYSSHDGVIYGRRVNNFQGFDKFFKL